MLVLVRPYNADFLRDELFRPISIAGGQWLNFMAEAARTLLAEGIELHTWDMRPMAKADIVLIQDLPLNRAEVVEARAKAPQAKFVLQILETPLDRLHHHDPANHSLFDGVLTYNRRQAAGPQYFHYRLPVAPPPRLPAEVPYEERQPLVMINSNRVTYLFGRRRSGLSGLPGIGPMLSGWHVPFGTLLRESRGALYGYRRRLARAAERLPPGMLNIYGHGWRGEPIGWFHRFVPHRPYACARGIAEGWKVDYLCKYRFALAFENVRSNVGYLSEKLFDNFFAGAVPIYLGDEQISDAVPPECFVDARQFDNEHDLLKFAAACSRADWTRMRDAGKAFITSAAFEPFTARAFARAMSAAFRHVTTAVPTLALGSARCPPWPGEGRRDVARGDRCRSGWPRP